MKTNKVMKRKMGAFEINQRTKDGMFNATALLKQWNREFGMKKSIDHFFENQGTKDFIEVLASEENLHTRNSVYVKSRASRGDNAGTWMHPILFIKFAMWVNPKFEYYVIKFVHDQLIEYRHKAGDHYRGLTRALALFENADYGKVAKAMNFIVFGIHQRELRQTASVEQLKALTNLQEKLAFAIDMGYIRTFDALINEMRRIYHIRNQFFQLP